MNCSRCGRAVGAVFPGAKITCACGAEITVGREDGDGPYRAAPASARVASSVDTKPRESRRLPCPSCGDALAGAGILACGRCEGAFFTERALAHLLDEAVADVGAPHGEHVRVSSPPVLHAEVRYLSCPMCGERMNRTIFAKKSGIVVDVCPNHGTWFDAGEVERAVAFARKHDVGSAKPSDAPLTDEDVRKRAEVEVLLAKERIDDDTEAEAWRARAYGGELTWIERLAIAIKWLRGE